MAGAAIPRPRCSHTAVARKAPPTVSDASGCLTKGTLVSSKMPARAVMATSRRLAVRALTVTSSPSGGSGCVTPATADISVADPNDCGEGDDQPGRSDPGAEWIDLEQPNHEADREHGDSR
jgi:hypothetical protein